MKWWAVPFLSGSGVVQLVATSPIALELGQIPGGTLTEAFVVATFGSAIIQTVCLPFNVTEKKWALMITAVVAVVVIPVYLMIFPPLALAPCVALVVSLILLPRRSREAPLPTLPNDQAW